MLGRVGTSELLAWALRRALLVLEGVENESDREPADVRGEEHEVKNQMPKEQPSPATQYAPQVVRETELREMYRLMAKYRLETEAWCRSRGATETEKGT